MKTEMRTRVGDWRFIHIHSAAQAFFIGVNGATDHGIHKTIHRRQRHRQRAAEAGDPYRMIDEAQDLKPYSTAIRRRCTSSRKCHGVTRHHVGGDARQEVNRWNHADARFMTMSDRLGYNDRDWSKAPADYDI
jgi:hypothetical protein